MNTEELTYGGLSDTEERRRQLAAESLAYNMDNRKNRMFRKIFDDEVLAQIGAIKKQPEQEVVKGRDNCNGEEEQVKSLQLAPSH